MKKIAIQITLAAIMLSGEAKKMAAQATQSVDYTIYAPSKDSFFLVESVTGVISKEAPKPQISETFQLFRSEAQLSDYVAYLRSQAVEARKQAQDLSEQSKKLTEMAPKIDSAADKISAVIKENEGFFRAETPKAKPKKKKKS